MDSKIKMLLVDCISSDWKCFSRETCLKDIDSVVENIDNDYTNDQSKMEAFLKTLYEREPCNFLLLVKKSLKAMSREDILRDIELNGKLRIY